LYKSYFRELPFIHFVTIKEIQHFDLHTFLVVVHKYFEYMLDKILQNIGMYHYLTQKLKFS